MIDLRFFKGHVVIVEDLYVSSEDFVKTMLCSFFCKRGSLHSLNWLSMVYS